MVDQTEPRTNKLTHLRPKTFKQEMFKKREIQNENDHLVLRILKLRQRSREALLQAKEEITLVNKGTPIRRAGSARQLSLTRSGRMNKSNDHLDVPKQRSGSARGESRASVSSNKKKRGLNIEEINASKVGYTRVSPINSKFQKLVNIGNI